MGISDKKVFQLYHDLVGVVGVVTDEQAGKLFKAILAYVNGQPPRLDDPVVLVAFQPIKQQLDRNHEAYLRILERNKENGKKGGRPKKTQENPENPVGYLETQENPSEPKKADKDKDKDKDIKIKKETSKKKTKLDILYELPLPEALGFGFSETWKQWLSYLNQARKLPTAMTATKQLEKLEQWGAAAATCAIEKSIECGWRGLFKPTPQELANLPQQDNEPQSLPEPEGWYSFVMERYPQFRDRLESEFQQWEDLPLSIQETITEDMRKLQTQE